MNKANSIINKFLLAGTNLCQSYIQHDMVYNIFKDLEERTESDIVLKNKALKIASNPKDNGYERGFAIMIYKFFDKISKGSCIEENQWDFLQNSQLANELHKQSLESSNKGKYILPLRIIFGVLI